MHLKPEKELREIAKKCFQYNGNKFQVRTDIPKSIDSFWSGGSRDFWAFYDLNTKRKFNVQSNHPIFEKGNPRVLNNLPIGILLLKHSIFCGKDMGITFYVNPQDISPLLQFQDSSLEITEDERIVLKVTSRYKSSYNGIKDYRFYEAQREYNLTQEQYRKAKESLIEKKLLRKNGSITPDGRNAI